MARDTTRCRRQQLGAAASACAGNEEASCSQVAQAFIRGAQGSQQSAAGGWGHPCTLGGLSTGFKLQCPASSVPSECRCVFAGMLRTHNGRKLQLGTPSRQVLQLNHLSTVPLHAWLGAAMQWPPGCVFSSVIGSMRSMHRRHRTCHPPSLPSFPPQHMNKAPMLASQCLKTFEF